MSVVEINDAMNSLKRERFPLNAHNPRDSDVSDKEESGNADRLHEKVKQDRRRNRYRALGFLRQHSSQRRVQQCSFGLIPGRSTVAVKVNEGGAYFANIRKCGAVHVCPICSPKVRAARAREIEVALAAHRATGGGVEFVTLTLRHHAVERLESLLGLVADGFRTVIGSGRWVREWYLEREAFGVLGTIRTLELTHGENGWHPHLHVLVLTKTRLSDHERQIMQDGWWQRWSWYLERKGHHGTTREHGIDWREVRSTADVSRYMAKVYDNLHHEMARSDLKEARHGGRNPFRLLSDLVEAGKYDRQTGELNRDYVLWREYELAIKGRQFLTWSTGIKQLYGVDELTDEEHAEAEVGGEIVFELDRLQWARVRCSTERMAELLRLAETRRGGALAVVDTWALRPTARAA
jgi:hypothetical protein